MDDYIHLPLFQEPFQTEECAVHPTRGRTGLHVAAAIRSGSHYSVWYLQDEPRGMPDFPGEEEEEGPTYLLWWGLACAGVGVLWLCRRQQRKRPRGRRSTLFSKLPVV